MHKTIEFLSFIQLAEHIKIGYIFVFRLIVIECEMKRIISLPVTEKREERGSEIENVFVKIHSLDEDCFKNER